MTKYDKDTKFYYLQVKEDFFDDDAIEWLEDRPNGEKYSNFYLKLCLKSLKTNGILIKRVGTMLIPYDAEALQKLTGVKELDTVKVAMDLLIKAGLVQITEEHAIYINQLENLVGSKSLGALKKQQQIARRETKKLEGGKGVENFPPKIKLNNFSSSSNNNIIEEINNNILIELEKEEEIYKEEEKEIFNIFDYFEQSFGRTIAPAEFQNIVEWQDCYEDVMLKKAIDIAVLNNKRTFGYVNGILNNWKSCGYKTLQDVQDNEIKNKHQNEIQEVELYDYNWLDEEISDE